jgi:sporulation related protein
MADDYKRSFRSNDPSRSAAESPHSIDFSAASDPLAELARLIGQSDPFPEYGRTPPRAPQPRDPLRELPTRDLPTRDLSPRELLSRDLPSRDFPSRDLPSRDFPSRDLPSLDRSSSRGYSTSQPATEWPPSLGTMSDRRYEPEPRGQSRDSYPAFGDYPPSRSTGRDPVLPSDDYLAARGVGRDSYASQPAFDDLAARSTAPRLPLDEPRWTPQEEPRWAEPQQHGDTPTGSAAQDAQEEAYSDGGTPAVAADDESEFYYQDDPLQPEDEEAYDDAPGTYRRNGVVTAVALILCAMLGTAGAYAYRSYVHTAAKEPPPVISADNSTPAKVVPAPASDARSGKQINERFATAAAGSEQLVSRQEEPVALREPGTATAPRVVLPAPVQPAQSVPPAPAPPVQAVAPPQPAPPAVAPPATTASTPGSEPKRVRTVTIRPDGSDPSGRPVTNTTPPAPRAAPTPPAPRATTPPAPRAAAPPRDGGPLSLQPNDSRTAVAPPPGPFANFSSSGGYVVQLSSQRTENEAHSSFRALQAKFPNELGSRQVIIRRADLGAKGVVYRTNVGPFATAQEAQRFCASYKSAGGQCIVPTN